MTTHTFGWNPLERLQIALRPLRASARPAFSKRALAGAAAIVLALGGIAGGSMLVAGADGAAQTPQSDRERSLLEREAELAKRERTVAELERRGAARESEIKDSEKRIAALEERRAELQRQVAELTAPVAPAEGDIDGDQPDLEGSAAKVDRNDPSPPDEASTEASAVSAASRPDDAEPTASTATVDGRRASAEEQSSDLLAADAAVAAHAGGAMRVFIHVRSSDPSARERAQAVASELRRRGVSVAEIRGVPRPVRRDAVRYFHDADREAASAVREAVREASPLTGGAPQSQDFRGFRAPPRPGTLELWLS